MRRSSAPSKLGAKFNSPLMSTSSKPSNIDVDNTVSAPFENAARTTQSILGLIGKVKQSVEDSTVQSSAETADSQIPSVNLTKNIEGCNDLTTPNKRVFNVVYGKPSKKKHKSWEGDGLLEIGEKTLTLRDCDGNVLGRGSGKKNSELDEGSRLYVGNKEVEIIDAVSSITLATVKRPLKSASPEPVKQKKRKVRGTLSTIGGLRRPLASIHEPFTPLHLPQPDLDHQVGNEL